MILELVGYFASFLVLVSLLMTSVVKLRVINAIGSAIFTVYAVLIHSYPTAVMNFCLVLVNLYFLWKYSQTRVLLSLEETPVEESGLHHFLNFYAKDIQIYFPNFVLRDTDKAYMVYADGDPVGVLVGSSNADTLTVTLDYSVPKFRDCSVGAYLYGELPGVGISTLLVPEATEKQARYLKKMGFSRQNAGFQKNLRG